MPFVNDPLIPQSAICNRRTGFVPTAVEQHYAMMGLSPAAIVKGQYGEAAEGSAAAEWQRHRVEKLAAWQAVWLEDWDGNPPPSGVEMTDDE